MPRYKLPPPPSPRKDDAPVYAESDVPDEWARRIHIPVNEEIIQALRVGEQATVTLTGEIYELSSSQGRDNLAIQVEVVDAYPGAEMGDDEEEDAFEEGFDRKSTKQRNRY